MSGHGVSGRALPLSNTTVGTAQARTCAIAGGVESFSRTGAGTYGGRRLYLFLSPDRRRLQAVGGRRSRRQARALRRADRGQANWGRCFERRYGRSALSLPPPCGVGAKACFTPADAAGAR